MLTVCGSVTEEVEENDPIRLKAKHVRVRENYFLYLTLTRAQFSSERRLYSVVVRYENNQQTVKR